MKDIRTLVEIANVAPQKTERVGIAHNALDDCLFQVKYCVRCFKKLKGE